MILGGSNAVYSVTSLTRELKSLVEGKYRFVQVKGEISNLKRPFSGHSYFTLKDDGAQLRSVLFKGQSRYLEKGLEDGQQVVCHGRISIYEPRGDYQLIVDSVDFQGSGKLQQRFEQLKRKLQEEGLFSHENKKELPPFPGKVVLLTSPSGAAIHDFLNIWRKRDFPTHIQVYGVSVQGPAAAEEIAKGVEMVNVLLPETDIIVLCRGGGSLEDLWAFNEEVLARSIVGSTIPVVSAIGHEVDFSISDFCADLRAPTPTAAAEMIFPDANGLQDLVARYKRTISRILLEHIDDCSYRVQQNRRILGDMDSLFSNALLRVDHASHRLLNLMQKQITRAESALDEQAIRLQASSPSARVNLQRQRLQFATDKLLYLCKNMLIDKASLLHQQAALLDAVSPLATLGRGYSITRKIHPKSGKKTVITGSAEVDIHDHVEVRLQRGAVECEVIALREEDTPEPK